jgi:RNA-directed DNA polymerase
LQTQYLACCLSDFIITAASKELLEQEIKPLVEAFMKERGLELSREKTCITHIEDGFDFLGQNVRKYKTGKRHKLLIKPAKKNVHAHLEKFRDIVKKNQTLSAGRLILMLNPIIRGWAQYHQHIVSADVFSSVDDAIYRRLRQWMRRRHPKKSNKWITKKYFKTYKGNNWVFYGEKQGQEYYLAETASVPIKRHAKGKAQANPYDPEWETYYEKRLDVHIRRDTERETLAHPSLERAKRTLPNVPTENHEDHRLAQPSHRMEVKRWP